MEKIAANGLMIFFDAEERQTAELVRSACEKSARLLHEHWELETPADCRVYVMTSWRHFIFHSAPWHWRVLLTVTMPLWAPGVRRKWELAGGWAQQFGRRRAIGVKPAHLIQLAGRGMGERVFVQETDMNEKVQHITCHELTHGFTHHLRLPIWLHEGLAMVAVDKFSGRPTVQRETLDILERESHKTDSGRYPKVEAGNEDALIYLYVQGYWVARYLVETQPDLLKHLLSQRRSHGALESEVAAALGMERDVLWQKMNGIIVSHFENEKG